MSLITRLFQSSSENESEPAEDALPNGAVTATYGETSGDERTGEVVPTGAASSLSHPAAARNHSERTVTPAKERPSLARERSSPRTRRREGKKVKIPHGGRTVKGAAFRQPLRPTIRGWLGRGGGEAVNVTAADEFRGTTVQVCGLYPFSVGTGTPMIGVPLGKNLSTGASVCCDPISWFQRAQLISNPSMFVLSKPGLGKSSLTRRMAAGLAGYGTIPLVLGDL